MDTKPKIGDIVVLSKDSEHYRRYWRTMFAVVVRESDLGWILKWSDDQLSDEAADEMRHGGAWAYHFFETVTGLEYAKMVAEQS